MKQYKPYQLETALDIVEKKRVILADDMGMGKTAESIAGKTAVEARRPGYDAKALVTCPNGVVDHWENEIKDWYKKGSDTNIAIVQSQNYRQGLEQALHSDFTILDYATLSSSPEKQYIVDQLSKMGFKYGILDEAHNAKNPESIRSAGVKNMYDSMEYLVVASGTPIPDSVVDIYMLLSLMDKEKFPVDPENPSSMLAGFYQMFKQDPGFVSGLINDVMIRRTADEYLHKKFPEIRQNDLEVTLEGDHRDAYLSIYENSVMRPGSKLWQLIKTSVDPNLADPRLLDEKLIQRKGPMESSVYQSLDRLIEKVVDDNGKVLIFSDLKEGVTNVLKNRFSKYGAVVIDGDVSSERNGSSISEREQTRRKFQKDPDCKVMIATTVMDEGVDLTAATDLVHLTIPYTPAAVDQRNRRAQRIGEVMKDYVNIHTVKPQIPNLTVITEGIQRLVNEKRTLINYLLHDPFSINVKDLKEVENGAQKSRYLGPLIRSPMQEVISHFGKLKKKGGQNIRKFYDKRPEQAENIARLYSSHWKGYFGGNTGNLYAKIISRLDSRENLERKLDIASGPFSLSRALKQPVTNLDLNPYMLEAGKIMEEEGIIVPGNTAVQGLFNKLPFDNESFDLAVCSLALHMSKSEGEREQAFREMNRVLRKGGRGIVTLANTWISRTDEKMFYNALEHLGFEVSPYSGVFRGPEDSTFKVYLAGVVKKDEPNSEILGDEAFEWKVDRKKGKRVSNSTDKRGKHKFDEPGTIARGFVTEFFNDKSGMPVEELIR